MQNREKVLGEIKKIKQNLKNPSKGIYYSLLKASTGFFLHRKHDTYNDENYTSDYWQTAQIFDIRKFRDDHINRNIQKDGNHYSEYARRRTDD